MEQSYKEKYEQALSKAKDMLNYKEVRREDMEYLFPELAESEGEKVRKELICFLETEVVQCSARDKYIAWLERQGEHANFLSKIQVGDKVTRNEDGILVNLSQLERVAKTSEKQSEQKLEMKTAEESLGISSDEYNKIVDECIFGEQESTDKDEPKFKVGDWLIFNENHNSVYQVEKIDNYRYYLRHYLGGTMSVHFDNELIRLWTLQDAKSGDVLYSLDSKQPFIYKERPQFSQAIGYCCTNIFGEFAVWNTSKCVISIDKYIPATKEQRDLLFQKMNEAGYTFDFENKKLKKIEPKTKENKGNIGGISANWSVEDMSKVQRICKYLNEAKKYYADITEVRECIEWLKSLQDRVQPQPKQGWRAEDEAVLDALIRRLKGEDIYVSPHLAVECLESLKSRVKQKQEWSEEDEQHIDSLLKRLDALCRNKFERTRFAISEDKEWLKSIKERMGGKI